MFAFKNALFFLGLTGFLKADNEHGVNSVSLSKDDFSKLATEKKMFVMFFAPWCGHCKRLAPTWDELAKIYNNPESEAIIAKVDCTVQTALCADNGVSGYPTLKMFHKSLENPTQYRKSRELDALKGFVEEQLAIQPVEEKVAQKAEEDFDEEIKKLKMMFELTADNFDSHIATGNHFIKFYAPWCGHCKQLAPTWQELSNVFRYNDLVTIAKVDCTAHSSVCRKFGVNGYPTMLWFSNGKQVEKYQSKRDLENLSTFVKKMLLQREDEAEEEQKDGEVPEAPQQAEEQAYEKPAVEEKAVLYELTSDSFDSHIKTGNHFIKFYAPWCGHCQRLAPVWEDLAESFESNDKITVAKVDCTKHSAVCSKFSVRGYPTLLFFSGGEKVDQYQSSRGLSELSAYVTKMIKQREENVHQDDGKIPEDLSDESDVEVLTDEDFAEVVSEDYTFVKFFAPYCGHCKRMAPAWEELAEKYDDNEEVVIAEIDCTKYTTTCSKYKVNGYPTLLLFRNGVQLDEYSGERTAKAFSDWLTKIMKEKTEL